MAWIDVIPVQKATGALIKLYAKYVEPSWGGVDNIIAIHSLNPKSMANHYDMYAHLMRGRSPLSRTQREMIAVATSAQNHCRY